MITVVDQVRPWLTPSSTLANDDPAPRRRPDQQQRDREADEPAGDEDGLAAVAVRQGAGEEVGGRLHDAEGGDERERGGERGEPELVLGEQRQDGALLADHAADERVDADEQRELGEVLAQPEPRSASVVSSVVFIARPRVADRSQAAQSSGPPSSTDDVAVAAGGRGGWRRSWPARRGRTSP